MPTKAYPFFFRSAPCHGHTHVVGPRLGSIAGQVALRQLVCILIVWWAAIGPAAAQAVERFILVLKDGRRIAVSRYETSGDQIYYERFDARVGIARSLVETILVIPQNQDTPVLEDVILGRVLRIHNRQFAIDDFLREDFFVAEIEPRLTPEEQIAYVRKLIRLKQWEVLEIEDKRMIAERQGDIVDMGEREQKLVDALRELMNGQRALSKLRQRHRAGPSRNDSKENPAGPEEFRSAMNPNIAAGRRLPAEVSIDALMDPATGLGRLQHRREMLVLVIKKNYEAGEKAGGVLALQQARQDLRIVDLQIRYFDQLAGVPASSPAPP